MSPTFCNPYNFCPVLRSCASREAVDEMIDKAIAAGGTAYKDPQDHGFMYEHGFQDLEGHLWEIIFMQPNALKD
jgi:predicted lactoylglutathione lyase